MHTNRKNPSAGNGARLQWLRDRADHAGDDCLYWPFSHARGYGTLGVNGRGLYAHRTMCELAHGPAPSPMHQAAHSCGRGAHGCVNPKHISWKTPSENQLDRSAHGTAYRNGRRKKLTARMVKAIHLLKGKMTHDEMAEMFGVSRRTIGAVLDGRAWPTEHPAKMEQG